MHIWNTCKQGWDRNQLNRNEICLHIRQEEIHLNRTKISPNMYLYCDILWRLWKGTGDHQVFVTGWYGASTLRPNCSDVKYVELVIEARGGKVNREKFVERLIPSPIQAVLLLSGPLRWGERAVGRGRTWAIRKVQQFWKKLGLWATLYSVRLWRRT